MMARVTVGALLALLCAGAVAGQQPAPPPQEPDFPSVTFRLEVNYVEVDVFVTDARGELVTDLTVDDFEVLEDGEPQTVSAFSLVDIPIDRALQPLFATLPIEPDVQTNSSREGRVYLIVLDDLHIDPLRGPRVKAAARRFLEQSFGTNDLAAVVYTSGRAADSQDFTSSRRLLLNAIDRFTGRKMPSATMERLSVIALDPATGQAGPIADPAEMERSQRARSVMSSVRRLAEFMAGVRGRRKALLLISEGVDYDIHSVMGLSGATASAVLADTQDAIAAATRGNVIIYGLDPRGLTTGGEELIGVSSTFPDQGVGLASLQSELRLSQDSLRVLAIETGGFAAVNRNDLDTAFDRIVQENSTYYLLGYNSSNQRRDGRTRRLQVRVTRPGLQVRARDSYVAPRGRAPAPSPATRELPTPVADALGSPLPLSGLALSVFAAPYKGTAPNAVVVLAVELNTSMLDFVEAGGTFNELVEVAFTATDANGKVFPGERHTVELALKPDSYQRARTHGLRVLSQANLPPGRYQLRVAAANGAGRVGSVLYDLDVPDFFRTPLVMGGVALTSRAARDASTVAPHDPLRQFLPSPVSTARTFASDDAIVLFTEVYQNVRGGQPRTLDLRAELRAEGGRVLRSVAEERSSAELPDGNGGHGFTAELPLDGLEPGVYVVRVQGQVLAGDRPLVARDVRIRVR